jgi:MFS family permease
MLFVVARFLLLSAPPLPSRQSTDRASLRMLMLVRIFRSLAGGLINLAFPFLVLIQIHQSYSTLGEMYGLGTIVTAISGLFFGFGTDLIGRKPALVVATSLVPISTFLILLSQNVLVLFAAAMIGGYSATASLSGGGVGGAAAPIVGTITADLTSREDRSFYLGFIPFAGGLAGAFGALLGGQFTIVNTIEIATLFGLVSTLLSFFVKERFVRSEGNGNQKTSQRVLNMKSRLTIGKFTVTGILNGVSNGMVTPFLIPFFILVYGITRGEMAVYATISGLIASFSLLLAPKLERSLGFLRTVVATRVLSAALALVLPLVRVLPISLAVYFAFPTLRTVGIPLQQTAMMDMVESGERGRALGLNQVARQSVSAGGTFFSGIEFDRSQLEIPFDAFAAIILANVFLYVAFFHSYRDPLREKKSGAEKDSS